MAVDDLMQSGYVYFCTEPIGKNFHADFHPELTPKQMLQLGVFGGKYLTDCRAEKLSAGRSNGKRRFTRLTIHERFE